MDRVRRIAREHRAAEGPRFDPEKRGTWRGSSRDLVVNGSRYTVIESKRWRGPGGRTASPYGAVPWTSEREKSQWDLETVGWTVRDEERGTVGIGRQPWKTKREAEEWVEQQEARRAGNRSRLNQNPARARRGDKHGRESDEEFVVIEEEGSNDPGFILVNPTDYPSGRSSTMRRSELFALQFGAYGWTKLLVWARSAEAALEEASGWLAEHAPGIFVAQEELRSLEKEYREENPEADDDDVMDNAYADLTYTEDGYIPSWEWTLDDVSDEELLGVALEASKDEYELVNGEDAP